MHYKFFICFLFLWIFSFFCSAQQYDPVSGKFLAKYQLSGYSLIGCGLTVAGYTAIGELSDQAYNKYGILKPMLLSSTLIIIGILIVQYGKNKNKNGSYSSFYNSNFLLIDNNNISGKYFSTQIINENIHQIQFIN